MLVFSNIQRIHLSQTTSAPKQAKAY